MLALLAGEPAYVDRRRRSPRRLRRARGKNERQIRHLSRSLPHGIPGLVFDNVRDRSLAEIWQSSPAFEKFRGEGWMSETCRSCERRAEDFGGCRCQAFLLTGDASATDPVCSLSPHHDIVRAARERAEGTSGLVTLRYRGGREAKAASGER